MMLMVHTSDIFSVIQIFVNKQWKSSLKVGPAAFKSSGGDFFYFIYERHVTTFLNLTKRLTILYITKKMHNNILFITKN